MPQSSLCTSSMTTQVTRACFTFNRHHRLAEALDDLMLLLGENNKSARCGQCCMCNSSLT
jgi:hypothetical protein